MLRPSLHREPEFPWSRLSDATMYHTFPGNEVPLRLPIIWKERDSNPCLVFHKWGSHVCPGCSGPALLTQECCPVRSLWRLGWVLGSKGWWETELLLKK